MKNPDSCSLKSLVKFIDSRKYIYNDARPYHKVRRKIISYAPVPYIESGPFLFMNEVILRAGLMNYL